MFHHYPTVSIRQEPTMTELRSALIHLNGAEDALVFATKDQETALPFCLMTALLWCSNPHVYPLYAPVLCSSHLVLIQN